MTAISTSGHPALRRTRTGCPLDAKQCKWHVIGVRCAAPIGTNEIWRAIWLRWLDLGRGRSSGRHFGEVTARPAPQDRRRVRRLATFGTRAQGLARAFTARDLARRLSAERRESAPQSGCSASHDPPTNWPASTCSANARSDPTTAAALSYSGRLALAAVGREHLTVGPL